MAAGGIWLIAPTRFAALSRRNARIVLALAVLLLLACLTAVTAPGPAVAPDPASASAKPDRVLDRVLYENIVTDIGYGDHYYAAAARELRAGDFPLKPFFTFRLPTLAVIEAALPRPVTIGLLYLLAAITTGAWYIRLGGVFTRWPPRGIATVLMATGLASFIRPDLIVFHEIWAGPLIALSLAVRRPGNATAAIAIGLCAMLIRETAALYCGLMALAALAEGRRREFVGWSAAILVFLAAVACHAWAVSLVVRPFDTPSPGWMGMLGPGFFVKIVSLASVLAIAPAWLAALVIGMALIGWIAWRDPLGTRTVAMIASYALLISVFCRADTFYWAVLPAVPVMIGLLFAPDAVRDLWSRARDTRRITVTRVVR